MDVCGRCCLVTLQNPLVVGGFFALDNVLQIVVQVIKLFVLLLDFLLNFLAPGLYLDDLFVILAYLPASMAQPGFRFFGVVVTPEQVRNIVVFEFFERRTDVFNFFVAVLFSLQSDELVVDRMQIEHQILQRTLRQPKLIPE